MIQKKTIMLIVILLNSIYSISANDGYAIYNPSTGSVILAESNEVRMKKEIVIYDGIEKTYDITFLLENLTDEQVIIDVIFPILQNKDIEINLNIEDVNFKSWLDSTEIESMYQLLSYPNISETPFHSFLTENIIIEPNSIVKLEHKYNIGPTLYSASNNGESFSRYTYVVKTGRSWASSIGEGFFSFKIPTPVATTSINNPLLYTTFTPWEGIVSVNHDVSPRPDKISIEDNHIILEWSFRNYEPDFNIEIETTIDGNVSLLSSPDRAIEAILNETYPVFRIIEYDRSSRNFSPMMYFDLMYQWVKYHYQQEQLFDSLSDIERLEASIQFIVNYAYAINGYKFNNKIWLDEFSATEWYKPNSNSNEFSIEMKRKLDEITKIRNELRVRLK